MTDIIVIQTREPHFPRCCYLVKEEETVRRFLPGAFVLRGMRWDAFPGLLSGNKELREVVEAALSPGVSYANFFQHIYPFTMIPISTYPTPRGHRIKANELLRADPPPGRLGKYGRRRNHSANAPQAILFEAMQRAGVKIDGTLYNTPCAACLNLFEHIAGVCTLVRREPSSELRLCHMDILASSGILPTCAELSHPSERPLLTIN
jgi:hypothetical protein